MIVFLQYVKSRGIGTGSGVTDGGRGSRGSAGCRCFRCITVIVITFLAIIIIMHIYHALIYIYYALIYAPSAHMIHINLNTVFYTHVEHSPTKTIYIRIWRHTCVRARAHTHTRVHTLSRAHRHTHTHTHTHMTHCSKNWVLILVGAEILLEEEGFQFRFKI